jgi:hypothetical protein
MRREIIAAEEVRIWKETVADYTKVRWYLLGESEKNNEESYTVVLSSIPGLLVEIRSY